MPTPPSARETSLCGEPPTDPFYLSRKSKSALVPGTYDNSPRGTLFPSPPYLRLSQQPHVNQPPPTAHTHCSIARDRTSGTCPFAIHPNFLLLMHKTGLGADQVRRVSQGKRPHGLDDFGTPPRPAHDLYYPLPRPHLPTLLLGAPTRRRVWPRRRAL